MSKSRIRKLTSSLRFKVGLVVFAGVGALSFIVITLSDHQLSAASADAGRVDVLSIAKTFGGDLSTAGLSHPDLLRDRVRALQVVNPNILSVSLYAPRNGHLQRVSTTDPATTHAPIDNRESLAFRTGRYNYHVDGNERHSELVYPIRPASDRDGAVVQIVYNLRPLDSVLNKRLERFTIIALISGLMLSLIAMALLSRGVFRPLNKLREATRRITKGELATRLRWQRSDEIGALADDFDEMAATLEEHKRLEALALEDPLTGLLNHRAFQERLYAELSRGRREGYPVALVALDVDHFKRVNDTCGHAVGDSALRLVAQTIVRLLRPSDLSGRVGGDEFMLALHGTDASEARQVVERLRTAVASVEFGAGHSLTVSAGIAEFPRHAIEKTELMRLADGAMYWSKSQGRDRCSVYSPDTGEALSAEEDAERIRRNSLIRTVHALARAVDAKDGYTHLHSQRVAFYAGMLASRVGMSYEKVEMIRTAGILHDVGKIGIPDAILLKPDKLTEEELNIMRRHSKLGRDIIAGAGMQEVARWVLHLHERYDGEGYPEGLAAEEIPIGSRILHAADALEAMTSPRIYRPALSLEAALTELEQNAGTQFDPRVAQQLVEMVRDGLLRVGGTMQALDGELVERKGRASETAPIREIAG